MCKPEQGFYGDNPESPTGRSVKPYDPPIQNLPLRSPEGARIIAAFRNRDDDISDYAKYRGKCKEMSEAACAADATLTLVRGHYHCPFWGEQAHWWTTRMDGTVFDPTAAQFPSGGLGEYVPFNGTVECAQCGKTMREDEVSSAEGNYAFCSHACHGRFVGVY